MADISSFGLTCVCLLSYSAFGLHNMVAPDIVITRDFEAGMLYYRLNEYVVINCKATAEPPARYNWTFNGDEIVSDGIVTDAETGDLKIPSMSENTTGEYRCYAFNVISGQQMTVVSPPINIQLAFIDSWKSEIDPSRIEKDEGQTVSLTCDNLPNRAPTGQIKWYRDIDDQPEVKPDERITIDKQGTLHFMYVKKSDDLINNPYKCAIFIKQLEVIKLGSPKILNVNVGTIKNSRPTLLSSSSTTQSITGQSVEIECVFSGSPIPIITWTNNYHSPITNSDRIQIKQYGRILRINAVDEADQGGYTCKGANMMGVMETTIELNVTYWPIWTNSLLSQSSAENGSAVFTCKAQGHDDIDHPLEQPIWLENGFSIQGNKFVDKYEFGDNKRVLTVMNLISPDDNTCFQCSVKNDVGSIYSTGCLTVVKHAITTHTPLLPAKRLDEMKESREEESDGTRMIIIGSGIGAGVFIAVIAFIIFVIYKRKGVSRSTVKRHFYNEVKPNDINPCDTTVNTC